MAGMKKLNVRDVLSAIVIAVLALGWWTDHRMTNARSAKQVSDLETRVSELEQYNEELRLRAAPWLLQHTPASADHQKFKPRPPKLMLPPKQTTRALSLRWLFRLFK